MSLSAQHSDSTGFASLGLDSRIIATLAELEYSEPTPIQRSAIPVVIGGQDLVGQAATGTGKTAAFALPMLHRIASVQSGRGRGRTPLGLVLAPTRELAMQVAEAAQKYGKALGLKVLPIYGGQGYGDQLRGLSQGVDVVVATPGRALDHVRRGTLDLSQVMTVVLDEADEMLDMGFADDIEAVLEELPVERQVLLFSATMPPRIAAMARRHQKDPVHIAIKAEKLSPGAEPKVRETAYVVTRAQKLRALHRILEAEAPQSAIIFCRTREDVDQLSEALVGAGHAAEPLHGGISQSQRERVVRRLKDSKTKLVIATDVAARGLDIDQLSHVFNIDVPGSPETYVHRIGRVGRAGREGVAITFVEPRDHRLFRLIQNTTGRPIGVAKVPSNAELAARRFVVTSATLRDALGDGTDLKSYAPVLDQLAGEHDLLEVALAALKLVHQSLHKAQDDGEDVHSPKLPPDRGSSPGYGDRGKGGRGFGDRGKGGRGFGDRGKGGRGFSDRGNGGREFGDRGNGGREFGDRGNGGREFGDRGKGGREFGDRGNGGHEFGDGSRRDGKKRPAPHARGARPTDQAFPHKKPRPHQREHRQHPNP